MFNAPVNPIAENLPSAKSHGKMEFHATNILLMSISELTAEYFFHMITVGRVNRVFELICLLLLFLTETTGLSTTNDNSGTSKTLAADKA